MGREMKRKTIKLWGGFVNGKLSMHTVVLQGWITCPALFVAKQDAQARYQDVRPVELTYEEPSDE